MIIMSYVYIKTGKYDGADLTTNTIALNVTSVGVSVTKAIPSFPIPFSGVVTGESVTAALDLGMCTKTIDLQGFITDTTVRKTRTGASGEEEITTALTFTPHEIAQMIASGVDSTGLQDNQSFKELVVLMPSNVADDYNYRGICSTGNHFNKITCEDPESDNPHTGGWTVTAPTTSTLVPFSFGSRGGAGFGDNDGVLFKSSTFPDRDTDDGLTGFIRSFSFNMEAEAIDLSFSMQFEVAIIGP